MQSLAVVLLHWLFFPWALCDLVLALYFWVLLEAWIVLICKSTSVGEICPCTAGERWHGLASWWTREYDAGDVSRFCSKGGSAQLECVSVTTRGKPLVQILALNLERNSILLGIFIVVFLGKCPHSQFTPLLQLFPFCSRLTPHNNNIYIYMFASAFFFFFFSESVGVVESDHMNLNLCSQSARHLQLLL